MPFRRGRAYMRASCVKNFFRINISPLPLSFERLTRAQVCIDGTAAPLLGRAERSIPGARRVAPQGARGWRRKRAPSDNDVRPLRCKCHYCAPVDLSSSDYVCPIDTKAEPLLLCGTRRINLYPVGSKPVPRSLLRQCEGIGLQGGWDPSSVRRIAASARPRSHIRLGISNVPFVVFQRAIFSMVPSGTTPVSR